MGPLEVRTRFVVGVVEVLDFESGRALVSQVLDLEGGWGQFFAPGWMAVYDEEAVPQYRMWRLNLVGAQLRSRGHARRRE